MLCVQLAELRNRSESRRKVELCGWNPVFLKPETVLLRVMADSHACMSSYLNLRFPNIQDFVIGSSIAGLANFNPQHGHIIH
jgi:hypothetical protein